MSPDWILPEWPAPAGVRALASTRAGGVSQGAFAGLNLAAHVGDDPRHVAVNRLLLSRMLPAEPLWLRQVHGTRVLAALHGIDPAGPGAEGPEAEADACVAHRPGRVCAVLTADCLPVLFCDDAGSVVGAAHAGWRGLAAGVLENTVAAMGVLPDRLMAWLGPAIGQPAFEVGSEVREAFTSRDPRAAGAFLARDGGKWSCDLAALARQRLEAAGVTRAFGGGLCTFSAPRRFYSYRRDGATGRMAALIWLE